jgi:hypothetical protein
MYIVVPGVVYVPMLWLPWTCLRAVFLLSGRWRTLEKGPWVLVMAAVRHEGAPPQGDPYSARAVNEGPPRVTTVGAAVWLVATVAVARVGGASSVNVNVFIFIGPLKRCRERGQRTAGVSSKDVWMWAALLPLRHPRSVMTSPTSSTLSSLPPPHHLQAHARARPPPVSRPLRCTPWRWTRRAAVAPPPPRMAWVDPGGG